VSAAMKALGESDALMVVDEGKPIGVITRHDLLAFASTHPIAPNLITAVQED
jgi:cystathionine beta-synthase